MQGATPKRPPQNAPHYQISEPGGVGMYIPCGDVSIHALCVGPNPGPLTNTPPSRLPVPMDVPDPNLAENQAFTFVEFNHNAPDKFLSGDGATGKRSNAEVVMHVRVPYEQPASMVWALSSKLTLEFKVHTLTL
jgi:hypothetical protein